MNRASFVALLVAAGCSPSEDCSGACDGYLLEGSVCVLGQGQCADGLICTNGVCT